MLFSDKVRILLKTVTVQFHWVS